MKKFAFLVFAMMAALAFAYQVTELRNPVSGEGFTAGPGGKLVAVQAFSTNATGTIAINTVYTAPVFTNAVMIESYVATNYTIVSSNRIVSSSRIVPLRVQDGPAVVTTNVFTHAVETNIVYKTIETNMPNQVVFTNTLAATDFGQFTTSAWTLANPFDSLISVSTNITAKTETNVWPVVQRYVVVTNSIVSGSCSNHVYNGAPSGSVYLTFQEWVNFTGTATGGWIRFVFE